MPRFTPMVFPTVEQAAADRGPRKDFGSPWNARKVAATPGAVPFENLDGPTPAERERALVAAAEAKVASIIEEARKKGQEEGYAEGWAQGRQDGLTVGKEEATKEVADSLGHAIESLARGREALMDEAELDLAEMALSIAALLAGGALEIEPERIVVLARDALALLASADSIILRAGPVAAPILRDHAETLSSVALAATVQVVEDPNLEGSGCVVQSDLARIDLRVSERLGNARDLLTNARGEE